MYDGIESCKCRRCGKEYFPTPMHAYKDDKGSYCSWTCFNHRFDNKKDVRPIEMLDYADIYGKRLVVKKTFNSIAEALSYVGGTPTALRRAVKEERTYKHFMWRYKKD